MTPRSERGSLSVFFAVLFVLLIAVAVLLAEGGRRLSNISRAEDLASEAARAAAATLDPVTIAGGDPQINGSGEIGKAREVADQLLDRSGTNADLSRFEISSSGRSVVVEVTVRGTSIVPGFSIDGTGTHTAQVIEPIGAAP